MISRIKILGLRFPIHAKPSKAYTNFLLEEQAKIMLFYEKKKQQLNIL